MSTFAVDGLSSGLDTSSIIEQLMAVEAQPVRRLEARRDDLSSKVNAWGDLDTRLDALTDAISSIIDDDGINVLVGEASNPAVTATSTGEGAVGVFDMTVDQIATSHQFMSDRFASPSDLVGAGRATITSGLPGIGASNADIGSSETGRYTVQVTSVEGGQATIVFDGESHDVASTGTVVLTNEDGNTVTLTADGEFEVGTATISTMVTDGTTSIGALVTQLNQASGAAALQIVDTGDDTATPFTLVATARTPGVDSSLVIDVPAGSLGTFSEIREATNTIVTMGDDDLVIDRSDVVLEGVVPGMAVDLSGAEVGEELSVSVSRDTTAIVENFRQVIDAANAFYSGVSIYGRSDPENSQVGLLSGEFSLRRLESEIRDAFFAVGSGTISIGRQVGIEITQDGSISFDETTFSELVASDFGAVQAFLVGDGEDSYLGRIKTAVESVTSSEGVIENATTNLDASLEDIDDTIARYERRLETVEAGYRRQFTAMETLLAQLNSQSAFLASQLSGLGS